MSTILPNQPLEPTREAGVASILSSSFSLSGFLSMGQRRAWLTYSVRRKNHEYSKDSDYVGEMVHHW
jgi:hypothetical protein